MKCIILVPIFLLLIAPTKGEIFTVDDDGIADFNNIQTAIDFAKSDDIVVVQPSSYNDNVNFLGKNLTLTSTNPSAPEIVRETIIGKSQDIHPGSIIVFRGTENEACNLTGFNIKCPVSGRDLQFNPNPPFCYTRATISHCLFEGIASMCGGVVSDFDGTIANCIIADSMSLAYCLAPTCSLSANSALIKNCTFKETSIQIDTDSSATIQNCIFYTGSEFSKPIRLLSGATLTINYCNFYQSATPIEMQASNCLVNWGPGNIARDPCFTRLGVWEFNGPTTYYPGDYHLQSIAGRWNPDINDWVTDVNTSICIDAGNPGCPLDRERDDGNNVRVNIGAYGGTATASKPPFNWQSIADLTNDWKVGFDDLKVFTDYWLDSGKCIPCDLNRSKLVDFIDFAKFADEMPAKSLNNFAEH